MHAAMHANSSSSLAHIERKHKRSSLVWFRSRNDRGVSSSCHFSMRFHVLASIKWNEATSTPFVVTSKDIGCVDTLHDRETKHTRNSTALTRTLQRPIKDKT